MALRAPSTHPETPNAALRGCWCRYVMANLTKLMVLVSSVSKPSHPKFVEEIANLSTKIERAYKRAVSNPFIVPGSVRPLILLKDLSMRAYIGQPAVVPFRSLGCRNAACNLSDWGLCPALIARMLQPPNNT
jgi:hypothetical protein